MAHYLDFIFYVPASISVKETEPICRIVSA